MSTDQKLLYDRCKAVKDGRCPPALAKRKVGPVNHSRWLTTAVRILMLYMSLSSPGSDLTRMATFVLTVYSLLWFKSKLFWRATNASAILFDAMKLVKNLPQTEQDRVCPVLARGFYWGHSEQLLLGCLGSDDGDVRSRAVARIIALRHNTSKKKKEGKRKRGKSLVRVFNLPKPNYAATRFENMISWEKEEIHEPPLLRRYSNEQIREFEKVPLVLNIPSNSQHVERFIQLMASKATSSADPTVRDGIAKATEIERKRRPNLYKKPS